MNKGYFYNIIFLAFENLIKCENKYEVDIDTLSDYRKVITKRIKDNLDYWSKRKSDTVKNLLLDFIKINETMTKEKEKETLSLFLTKNHKLFGRKGNIIYLKKKVPYEDIAEVRYLTKNESIRDLLNSIYKEGTSFEAYESLKTLSIVNDVKKIIGVEKVIEETYINPLEETNTLKSVGNFYVRGKFLIIATKPLYVIDEYYKNIKEYSMSDNLDICAVDKLLSEKVKNSEPLYINNPYIYGELSNIFQTAIFSDSELHYKSLIYYFDNVWDYVYKDDMEDEEELDSYLPAGEEDTYDFTQEERDSDKVNLFFYINYFLKLNYYNKQKKSTDIETTRKRLLYVLNHFDSNLDNNTHLQEKYEELTEELSYYERDDYKDFYIMSILFLKDMFYGNIDELSLKKAIFISCYYDLTEDHRIKKLIENNKKINKKNYKNIYDAVMNRNYEALSIENINKIKQKKKE